MNENDTQVEEEVVPQEETTEETTEESQDEDVVTLSGDEKAEYEKYKAKKEERQRFSEQAKKSPPKQTYNVSADKLERMELKLDGYNSEEVEAIMELGGSKSLSNPLVKGAIESMRAKAKNQDSNQPLNSKSPVFKKFTQTDLNNMSVAELEAILPKD